MRQAFYTHDVAGETLDVGITICSVKMMLSNFSAHDGSCLIFVEMPLPNFSANASSFLILVKMPLPNFDK